MKGLIACEESQAVTIAFRNAGHEFYSNDIQECSGSKPKYHIRGDCFTVLNADNFVNTLNFLGGHPDCTFLTNSGVRWIASKKKRTGYTYSEVYDTFINLERYEKMKQAASFFKLLLQYVRLVGCGYIENPIMHKYALELINEKPTQIIQPYQFGHMEKKATCLWIAGLPKLNETNNVYEEMMKLPYGERAKVHYASPRKDRAKFRSKTYTGIAKAMAEQWGERE